MSARILTPSAIDPLTLFGASALQWWYRDGATISTAASIVAGTSPPALVLGGTLAFASMPSIRFECTAGGANPTLRYSADNGASFIATVSPTPGVAFNLTGALAGATATAPVGSYNVNNIWRYGVSSWTDKSGNGFHATQTPGTACPRVDVDATLGVNVVTGDASNDFFTASTAPVGIPGCRIVVYKTNAWTSGRNVLSGTTGGVSLQLLQMLNSTPELTMVNGGAAQVTTGAAVGSWVRVGQVFLNTLGDYLLCAGRLNGGQDNTGSNTGTGLHIFTNATGSSFASASLAENIRINRDISTYEWICTDKYLRARYGASLGLG